MVVAKTPVPPRSPSLKWFAMLVASVLLSPLITTLAGCGEGTGTPEGGQAAPKPGATFSGPVEITGMASSATISLVISADAGSITSVEVFPSRMAASLVRSAAWGR